MKESTKDITVTATDNAAEWTAEVIVYATTTGVTIPDGTQYMLASHDDIIEVKYRREGSAISHAATVTVDAEGPTLSNLSPAHNLRTKAGTIRFVADLKDTGAGLGETADEVRINSTFSISGEISHGRATKPDEGGSRLTLTVALEPGAHDWYIEAADALGNTERSVAVADDPDTEDTDEKVDDHTVVVDVEAPSIESATTGVELDTSEDEAKTKASGSRTAIAVTFKDGGPSDVEEGGGLDGDSIRRLGLPGGYR